MGGEWWEEGCSPRSSLVGGGEYSALLAYGEDPRGQEGAQ